MQKRQLLLPQSKVREPEFDYPRSILSIVNRQSKIGNFSIGD
jgi:hypothetical protein